MNEAPLKTYLPEISVIVSSYNHDKWLERCIRSLTHQVGLSYFDYEVLVIDDGSTDRTGDVLDGLKALENLKIMVNDKNMGLPKSLNRAIQKALGRYIVRVDSDDYVHRNFLFLLKLFLDMNREYQAVAVDYVKVDQNESVLKKFNCFENQIACGVMFRKECLFDIGLYDEEFAMREGHDLMQRFKEKFKLGRLEFPLYKYRDHESNRTKNKDILKIYDEKLEDKKEMT